MIDLDGWLNQHPLIRDRIVWEDGRGTRTRYTQWSESDKERLRSIFQKLCNGLDDLGIRLPDLKVSAHKSTVGLRYYFLTRDEAFDIFAAHVAHALNLEIYRSVPWSILDRVDDELDVLLASHRFFSSASLLGTDHPLHIDPDRDFLPQWGLYGLLSDPRVGYRFIRGETSSAGLDLLGSNEEETLGNLTLWMRDNVQHGWGSGYPVDEYLSRVFLVDRLKPRLGDSYIDIRAGCLAAAALMCDLARSINIPLLKVYTDFILPDGNKAPHSGILFHWRSADTRLVPHIDSFYASPQEQPAFPIDEDGAPIADVNRLLFDTYWRHPSELEKWGYEYTLKLSPWPTEYLGNLKIFGEIYHWWAGSWRIDAGKSIDYLNLYRTCAWWFVEGHCEGMTPFSGPAGNKSPLDVRLQDWGKLNEGMETPIPTLEECWSRMETCVYAHGGIEAVMRHHREWEVTLGYNVGKTGMHDIGTLSVGVFRNDPFAGCVGGLKPLYGKINRGVSLTFQEVNTHPADEMIGLVNCGGKVDAVALHTSYIRPMVNMGLLRSLDAYVFENWVEARESKSVQEVFLPDLSGLWVDGNIYAFPLGFDVQVMYYNKELFDRANLQAPPGKANYTWHEVRDWAKKLTLDGNGNTAGSSSFDPNNIVQWGVFIPMYPEGYEPVLLAFGGGIMSEDGQSCFLDAPDSVRAIQFIRDLMWADHTAPTPQQESLSTGPERFANGEIAMLSGGYWVKSLISKTNPQLRYGIAPLPGEKAGNRSVVNILSWAIPFNCTKPDAAWHFIQWTATVWACLDMGWIPAKKSLWPRRPYLESVFGDSAAQAVISSLHRNLYGTRIAQAIYEGGLLEPILTVQEVVESICENVGLIIENG